MFDHKSAFLLAVPIQITSMIIECVKMSKGLYHFNEGNNHLGKKIFFFQFNVTLKGRMFFWLLTSFPSFKTLAGKRWLLLLLIIHKRHLLKEKQILVNIKKVHKDHMEMWQNNVISKPNEDSKNYKIYNS